MNTLFQILNEIKFSTSKSNDVTKYHFDKPGSMDDLSQMGVKTIDIHLTKEERDYLVKNDMQLPPNKVTAYHAFTLNKSPATVDEYRAVHGLFSALKERDPKHVMLPQEIDEFIKASIDRLISKSKKPPTYLSSILTNIYKSYFLPFEGNVNKNVVLVPLGSTSGLVGKFTDQLKKTLNVPEDQVYSGAVMKNNYPYLSAYIDKKSKFDTNVRVHTLRYPEKYEFGLMDNIRSNISAYVKILPKPILDLIKDIAAMQKDPKFDEYQTTSSKESKSFNDRYVFLVDKLTELLSKEFIRIENQIDLLLKQYKSGNESAKDEIENLKSQLQLFPKPDIADKKTHGEMLNLMDMVKQYHIAVERSLRDKKYNIPETLKNQYSDALDDLYSKWVVSSFKIAKSRPRSGSDLDSRGYSQYQIIKKEYVDRLNGKSIVLLDDNVDSGKSVSDIVKSMYLVGIKPAKDSDGKPAIVVLTPHLLTTDESAGKVPSQTAKKIRSDIAATTREYSKTSKQDKLSKASMSKSDFEKYLKSTGYTHLPGQEAYKDLPWHGKKY